MKTPDEKHYRWCKPPTTGHELFRRNNYRTLGFEYFRRPAIKRGNLLFPERYVPDPEDPERSWKQGLEVDKPAQSAYQLNDGRVFWDPSKHRRNKGYHPYYRNREYTLLIDKDTPLSPVTYIMRPRERLAKFDDERFQTSAYNPYGAKYDVQHYPKWKGWIVP